MSGFFEVGDRVQVVQPFVDTDKGPLGIVVGVRNGKILVQCTNGAEVYTDDVENAQGVVFLAPGPCIKLPEGWSYADKTDHA